MHYLGKQARDHKILMRSHVDNRTDHMSLVTSWSRKNERVREFYKYVIASLTRDCVSVPFEQPRPNCKSCLKAFQLLICTTLILPGLALVRRCLPACDLCSLTGVFVHSSTDNVVGIVSRAH